jgi:phage protein U
MFVAIGLFIFDTGTALYNEFERHRIWAQARKDRFGVLPAVQFTGPASDSISISGTLIPEITGKYSHIETLAEMANTGDAYPVVMRDQVMGFFTIESLEEKHTNIIEGGYARSIDFTIELMRVEEGEDA